MVIFFRMLEDGVDVIKKLEVWGVKIVWIIVNEVFYLVIVGGG